MQTFLPYPDFKESAQSLDRARLGKQRVEVLQLARALHLLKVRKAPRSQIGWINHPACLMWADWPAQLISYGIAVCDEWIRRGYKDSCRDQLFALDCEDLRSGQASGRPTWLGDEWFHRSHQRALLAKQPEHYSRIFPGEKPEIDYYWPRKIEGKWFLVSKTVTSQVVSALTEGERRTMQFLLTPFDPRLAQSEQQSDSSNSLKSPRSDPMLSSEQPA